ncbi:TetR/AcrR family transcriptional regulator [Streptomyces sp. LP05-1]|uniref:TetR/AcrR family transcriptional regulator n=1 Tax=Streptomyces pyxinae TaxID=2970734 RepID=A0ABT2CQ36_9ACTN|nr:TetR/AcrR family transcriptional regulator [Streptomyces sp. LP05-1]MCS0638644.1 TetR/AcrR family transcriptional regulator [Streptomyces sp. LP05-1]
MTQQQRALRTRSLAVRAAAVQFDRDGYQGTALVQVYQRAGISMGALSFHFPTKRDLARAVREQGYALVRDTVAGVLSRPGPALATGVALTLTLARLLEENVEVRAAARLSRECPPVTSSWYAEWLPELRVLFRRAQDEGGLRPGSDPEALAALAAHLVSGAEVQLRGGAAASGARDLSPVAQLAQIWRVVLPGLVVQNPHDFEVAFV